MAAQELTLAEYARVEAHVAERYPLEEVLSHLGVQQRRWSRAKEKWSELLAADPALLESYTSELDRAVDALERRVRPIDDDAASWLTFLAALATQKEPQAWLERHDLGVNDLSRLKRLWERRCRADRDVAKRFAELEKDAAGRPLPRIVADPRKPLHPASLPGGKSAARARLEATAELPDDPLGRTLPFVGGSGAAAVPFAPRSSSLAAADAQGPIVTTLSWRGGDGHLRTTIVGKLSVYLQASAPPVLGPSDAIVAFDRTAADPRFVEVASEMAPWTVQASIIAYGGPLRFTFHPTSGEPLQVAAASGAPVGLSMSNAERARYAPKPLKRGGDGILTIPDEIDGRYFTAAPPTQQTLAIVGNERVVLEAGGAWFDTRLPGMVIVVTVEIGGRRRVVTLPFDTLAVHGDRRRLALVARAALPGEATLVGHALAPLHGASSPDAAPSPRRGPSTAALTEAELRAGGPVTPFDRGAPEASAAPPAASPVELARQLGARLAAQGLSLRGTAFAPEPNQGPALPFSSSPLSGLEFAAGGGGVTPSADKPATDPAVEEARKLGERLRAQGLSVSGTHMASPTAGTRPATPFGQHAAPARPPADPHAWLGPPAAAPFVPQGDDQAAYREPPAPTPQPKPAPKPVVAPPKRGAMAKPRIRKR